MVMAKAMVTAGKVEKVSKVMMAMVAKDTKETMASTTAVVKVAREKIKVESPTDARRVRRQ